MKNRGRVYAITSGVVVIIAVVFLAVIAILWYLYGYDYAVAPSALTLLERA